MNHLTHFNSHYIPCIYLPPLAPRNNMSGSLLILHLYILASGIWFAPLIPSLLWFNFPLYQRPEKLLLCSYMLFILAIYYCITEVPRSPPKEKLVPLLPSPPGTLHLTLDSISILLNTLVLLDPTNIFWISFLHSALLYVHPQYFIPPGLPGPF